MSTMAQRGVTVATTDFPLYTVHMVGDSHLLVAGGGGQAKTGVPNAIEIYGLSPVDGSCILTKVSRHLTDGGPAMNGCIVKGDKGITAGFGVNGKCYVYGLRSKILTSKSEGNLADGLRKRKGNLTDSTSYKAASKTLSFDLEQLSEIQTDFSHDGGYQRAVQFSPDVSVMVTVGADGMLRAWNMSNMAKLYEVKAHSDEVDDVHISPVGNRIVTIGKDNKACIWNTKDGSKKTDLSWTVRQDAKYKFRACRYGKVSDKGDTYCLYTMNIPLVRTTKSLPCYLTKWDTTKYVATKYAKTGTEILSSFAISDNGVFLGIGSMSGSVSIYIAFSLQKLYHLKESHSIFVTGLTFALNSDSCKAITGGHETTLFSISADNQIKMHQVAEPQTIHPLVPILGFLLSIYLFYVLITKLGL